MYRQDLSQKPFVFGQEAPSVFHRYVQSPPVELHHRDAELKPARQNLCYGTIAPLAPGGGGPTAGDSRLIVDGVQRLLHRGGLSLARAALVGQQIESYEGI